MARGSYFSFKFAGIIGFSHLTGSGSISPVPRKLRLIIILKEGFCRIYRFFVPESTLTNKPLLGAPVSGC